MFQRLRSVWTLPFLFLTGQAFANQSQFLPEPPPAELWTEELVSECADAYAADMLRLSKTQTAPLLTHHQVMRLAEGICANPFIFQSFLDDRTLIAELPKGPTPLLLAIRGVPEKLAVILSIEKALFPLLTQFPTHVVTDLNRNPDLDGFSSETRTILYLDADQWIASGGSKNGRHVDLWLQKARSTVQLFDIILIFHKHDRAYYDSIGEKNVSRLLGEMTPVRFDTPECAKLL